MEAKQKRTVFETLNAVNCNEHTEKKNGLTYLSWAWAWQMVKMHYPMANYTIYENEKGNPYFTDGSTCWVKTGVTIEGIEHIEYLPVMDYRSMSIKLDHLTSTDVNTAIQRSLTKACARHGLGLYIYAGEDIPCSPDEVKPSPRLRPSQIEKPKEKVEEKPYTPVEDATYWRIISGEAQGLKTKQGKSLKEWWINATNPTAVELAKFDNDVMMERQMASRRDN